MAVHPIAVVSQRQVDQRRLMAKQVVQLAFPVARKKVQAVPSAFHV
jgi:hypothetical protein